MLEILAVDDGAVPRTGTATITVYVGVVNDETPQFSASTFTGSTYEDTDPGYSVLQVRQVPIQATKFYKTIY